MNKTIFFISVFEKRGSQYLIEDYELTDVKLEQLQKIFNVNSMDSDLLVRDMVYCHEITEKEAHLLQCYVDFKFDLSNYEYMLEGRGDYRLSDKS